MTVHNFVRSLKGKPPHKPTLAECFTQDYLSKQTKVVMEAAMYKLCNIILLYSGIKGPSNYNSRLFKLHLWEWKRHKHPCMFPKSSGQPDCKKGLSPLKCPAAQRSQTFKDTEGAALPFILDEMISLYCVVSWKCKRFLFLLLKLLSWSKTNLFDV